MNELYHHGVKGMKWGVRRYQNEDGSLTPAGQRRARRDQKRSEKQMRKQIKEERQWAKKNRSLLSDEELNARITRLQKEKQFNELSKQELSPGKEKALSLVDRYANQAASALVGAAISGTVGIAISAHTNRELAKKGYHIKGYDEFGNSTSGNQQPSTPTLSKPKPHLVKL